MGLRGAKKFSYIVLVVLIRVYVKFSNFVKAKYAALKDRWKKIQIKRNGGVEVTTEQEPNKFLKMVGEYKKKIRYIKHRIKEEESDKIE